MPTGCAIGLKGRTGTVMAIRCHFEGYPSGVGRCLYRSYAIEERVRALIELGEIFSIGSYLSKDELPQDANPDDFVNAYSSDQNNDISHIVVYPNKKRYTESALDELNADYLYLFEDGRWMIYCGLEWNSPSDWHELKDILKRDDVGIE